MHRKKLILVISNLYKKMYPLTITKIVIIQCAIYKVYDFDTLIYIAYILLFLEKNILEMLLNIIKN